MTTLDIISDPICPWCYIGKIRLDRALEARPNHPFVITWRPFQLNPEMPPEGMDRTAYLETKFGGPEGAARVYGQIAEVAKDTGLEIDFDAIQRTANTLNAHRLLRWAAVERCQSLVANQLFTRYFQKGQDISDPEVLAEIAKDVGMDAAAIARLLAGDADRQEVTDEDTHWREAGVTSVPTFIVGGRYVVTGAQEPEMWTGVIDELLEKSDALG